LIEEAEEETIDAEVEEEVGTEIKLSLISS
jgi:hypothetical protein